ncbi:MAG: NAD(P)H-dependent oxidoreductase [Bacteroidota bacterium]
MITVICSTNRKNSNTSKVAAIYKELVEKEGEACEIIDLADMPADFISSALYENSGKNEAFEPIRQKMVAAQKIAMIVPEYNGSFPGVLKTFIDGLKFPDTFTNKKCALVGISSGIQGAVIAMSHLTDILNYCGTNVLAQKPKLSGIDKNMENGQITNPLYMQLLEGQVKAFIAF